MRKRKQEIPGHAEWAGYEADLDARYAHDLFFGKNMQQVQSSFGGVQSIERAGELLFVPRRVFQYYVLAFAEFVLSEQAVGDADSASPFLRLLISREQRDAGSVSEVYPELAAAVDYVAAHQERYLADPNIYGSFPDLAAELKALLARS
jgi:hypothetical protein